MANITIAQTLISSRATETFNVQNGPTPNKRDYLALYLPGATKYLLWSYLNNGRDAAHRPSQGVAVGTVTFANLALGQYEAKLFSLTDAGVTTLLTTLPFTAALPVNSGSGSGYGIGPFGDVPWDTTPVPESAYTVLGNGMTVPNIATVGWGLKYNENMDLLEAAFTDVEARLVAQENA